MFRQRPQHRRRRRHDIGADLCRFQHMHRMADAGDKDFHAEIVIVVDKADILDQLHAVEAIIVMAADEWRDEGRARLRRQQRLIGREAESHIDLRAFARQTSVDACMSPSRSRRPLFATPETSPSAVAHALTFS